MVEKVESNKKIVFDNDIVISSVMFDTCGAEELWFLPDIKKRWNVALIPAWHHLYTWRLKAAWYKWLTAKTWALSIILLWEWKWISLYTKELNCLWKKYMLDDIEKRNFCTDFGVKLADEWIENFDYELPYPRILCDYKKIYIFKIWEKTPKKDLNKIFDYLYKIWNVVFVSDLHSWLPIDECTKLDEETVNWKKDLKVFDWFFSLAEKKKKKARFIWYMNSSDMNWNINNTTWFCTMVF